MKSFLTVLFLFTFSVGLAQNSTEEQNIRKTIENFFRGFHARDSVVMKKVFVEDPVIQTIGKTQKGEHQLMQENLDKVLKGIVSIPLETEFKEVIHSYDIQVDGAMANVWTPYSFFLNGKFSHCGVNNFQLFKKKDQWKIIYLIDTRRRKGCEEIIPDEES